MVSKLTVIGNVPNTMLSWEKYEYVAWVFSEGKTGSKQTIRGIKYLLVNHEYGKRSVLEGFDMGQLVALRASIDALVAGEAETAESELDKK